MTPLAWLFMLCSWALILGCTCYSFFKLMTAKRLESDEDPVMESESPGF